MSDRDELEVLLRRARPAPLRGRAGAASAVRVLARVAALERVDGAPRVRASWRRRRTVSAAVAAGAVATVFLLAGLATSRREDRPTRLEPAARSGGGLAGPLPGGRGALAVERARDPETAVASVESLRALARRGGPRGAAETARVAALCADPTLASAAAEVLATTPSDAGPAALSCALLDAVRGARGSVGALVAVLGRTARAGRPAALLALRRGAEAGSVEAAVELLRTDGVGELDRVLPVVAAGAVPAAASAAVKAAPRALREALVRRAERGDEAAMRLAAAAGVAGLAEALRPAVRDPRRAAAAVAALATLPGDAGVVGLAHALSGPAGAHARTALLSRGAAAVGALADAAQRHAGDGRADPFLAALGALEDVGVPTLVALAERPVLAPRVVHALSISPSPAAGPALAGLRATLRGGAGRLAAEALAQRGPERAARTPASVGRRHGSSPGRSRAR